MTNPILKYDQDEVPLELRANPLHPTTDRYFTYLQDIQKAIVAAAQVMSRQRVMTVKLDRLGKTGVDIAESVGRNPAWVRKVLKTAPARKLSQLLEFYQQALDGPVEAQRRNILWRIATDNEQSAPKTAISAVAELNRMAGVGSVNQPQQTTIVINQQMFPKGALD